MSHRNSLQTSHIRLVFQGDQKPNVRLANYTASPFSTLEFRKPLYAKVREPLRESRFEQAGDKVAYSRTSSHPARGAASFHEVINCLFNQPKQTARVAFHEVIIASTTR